MLGAPQTRPCATALLRDRHDRVSSAEWLDLCHATINEELDPRHIAAVIRRQEDGGLADRVGIPDAAQGDLRLHVGDHPSDVIRGHHAMEHRRIGRSRAEDIHADALILQIENPAPREVADGGLRRAVDAERRMARDGACGGPEALR